MYEAMRQRAPNSTQIAGVATSVLITALAGYALANGFTTRFAKAIIPETIFTVVPPTEDTPAPIEQPELETTIELTVEKPIFIPEVFETVDSTAIAVKEGPKASIVPGPVVGSREPVRTTPRMRAMEKPTYPPQDVRAGNQGTTGLEVCVDARGRVTSASLKQSSGHVRLDEAALKWVRGARFTPGSVDGSPQAMCGHNVFYEWKIENGRT